MLRNLIAIALAAAIGFATTVASAASYPEKPITMIIGFNAGGGTDLAGRALAAEMSDILGQPIAVVNKPGGLRVINSSIAGTGYTEFHYRSDNPRCLFNLRHTGWPRRFL